MKGAISLFALAMWQTQAFVPQHSASTQLLSSTSLSSTVEPPAASSNQKKWFPTRIQEDVDYQKVVKSLYLRHIMVETMDVAQLALTQYLANTSKDPFGEVAKAISACPSSRDEGGKIGWIDIQDRVAMTTLITADILDQLVSLAPKTGDVHILTSSDTDQVHVIRVEEILIQHNTNLFQDESKESRIGSHGGRNAILPRGKLKGQGVMPEMPDLKQEDKTYHIQTAGCQMNVADSERLAGILENDLKLKPAASADKADVVMFNTCSIRDHAEQKLYDALGPFAARKRKGETLALIVTGCVAQQEGEELLRRVPEVDVVLGPQYVPFLANVLESVEWGHQVVVTAPMLHQEDNDFSKPVRGHSVRAWVNVIHGCNEHCTYCVVPATRGMEQSRTMENILQECLSLIESGYKEITLLGQNIDAYGRDMVPKRTFAELLEYTNANLPDGIRIRYVTSHPRYFSDRVIDAVANLDKVCEGFHMPFQAGDDQVLKRMRRGYTYESYMRIIHKIRDKAPDAAIYGDVIVGFPGETEEAFQRTLDLMKEVKFDNLNTFAYSPRPNTEAALWEDQVPEDVKSDRLQRVQKLATQHGLERSERYFDRVVEVLVEDGNPRSASQVMGRTRQGRQVYFDGDLESLRGELVNVRITEARTWSLMGKLEQ
jgi:tRNA-2-methylthio-N6-dimethylallyladenosine synthase